MIGYVDFQPAAPKKTVLKLSVLRIKLSLNHCFHVFVSVQVASPTALLLQKNLLKTQELIILNKILVFTDREIDREKTLSSFVRALAYKERTVLGFVALFDPHCRIKRAVFEESDEMDLDKAGNIVLDYLVMGRFFSSTGMSFNIIEYRIQLRSFNWLNMIT